jgi:alpha-L-rhamnosidase
MILLPTLICIILLPLQLIASTQVPLPAATHLRVNRLQSPLSIGTTSPVFSWIVPIVNTPAAGIKQIGYNIILSDESSNNRVIWDSQFVQSNQSINVPYLGPPLVPFGRYSFTIKWLGSNNQTSIGSSSSFGVGPIDIKDWQNAEWVGSDEGTGFLRATVASIGTNTDPIVFAQAYISAPGCASLLINGKRDDHVTKSGICKWEHFSKHRAYMTINLLPYLNTESNKENQFDIMLGHGMWTKYGDHSPPPTVLALFYFETKSGKNLYVPTKRSTSMFKWKYSITSYIIHDDPFVGAEMNWSWAPKWIDGLPSNSNMKNNSFIVYPMDVPTVIDQDIFMPKSVNYLKNEYGGSVYVYDLGTNIVGTCQVLASGKGTVHLRHGESLLKNGSLNLNFTGQDTGVKANFQHDTHHINNDTMNYYRPTFTWYGFQYVSVHVEEPTTLQFHGLSLNHSIICYQMYPNLDSSQRGSLEFGDDNQSNLYGKRLNDLHQIVITSQLGNIVQYAPTDCPTREKHFWLGDALDTAEEAFYNLGPDVVGIYSNFIQIVRDEQNTNHNVPGVVPTKSQQYDPQRACGNEGGVQQGCTDISWTAAYPLISDGISRHFGEDSLIQQHYNSIAEYMENLYDSSNDTLPAFFIWGDWCSMQPRAIATPSTGPPAASVNWIFSADAMARMSEIVKQPKSVVKKWIDRANSGRKKWHELYWNKTMGAYGYVSNGDFVLQTLTSLPLALENVVPEYFSNSVNNNYANDFVSRNYHGTFGSIGSKYIFNQLTSNGNHSVAMKLATKTTYPSYGYWISQGGKRIIF